MPLIGWARTARAALAGARRTPPERRHKMYPPQPIRGSARTDDARRRLVAAGPTGDGR
ncbi:MAG: hypothetical protein V9G12_04030 [Microthrixaceae bacterium]